MLTASLLYNIFRFYGNFLPPYNLVGLEAWWANVAEAHTVSNFQLHFALTPHGENYAKKLMTTLRDCWSILVLDSFATLNDDIFKRKQVPPTLAWSVTEAQRWLREQRNKIWIMSSFNFTKVVPLLCDLQVHRMAWPCEEIPLYPSNTKLICKRKPVN